MTWGATGLTVRFGATVALAGVDAVVAPGEVLVVVGGDGAGKTTLLRSLTGLIRPAAGKIAAPHARDIGYVPASGGVFADLTVAENLDFVGRSYGVREPRSLAQPLLDRTGLAPFTRRLAGHLSGGMRRKLAVIGAMLHRPQLLILDEPTTGIDPVSRADLWRLIAAAASDGAAIVVASAYLDEATRAASVVVLHEGSAVVAGSPHQVLASMPGTVVETDRPGNRSRAWRRGTVWHEWHPDGSGAGIPPDLEDVVIVAALRAEEGAR